MTDQSRYFDLLWEFGEEGVVQSPIDAPDQLCTSPVAIIAIWRYRYPVTFSRANQESFSRDPNDATRLRDEVLVIVEDIVDLTISSNKSSHITQLSARLLPGANYLTETFPGDWCAAWIVNSTSKADDLVRRIRAGEQCNGFNDGFKFLGRLAGGPRVRLDQSPQGLRTSGFDLNAAGFSEFDATVYYEPYLASIAVGTATEWLQKTGKTINALIQNGAGAKNHEGLITVNQAIPFFIEGFYGEGVPKNQGFADPMATTHSLDNPNAFVIPDEVGNLLGVTRGTKSTGKKGWQDVCNVVMGIQKYQLSNTGSHETVSDELNSVSFNSAGRIFSPDGLPIDNTVRRLTCPTEMLGSFLPSVPQFNGQHSVWAIMQQFLNPAVNEMYACLRAGPTGTVMPTLVVRQLPFTSGVLGDVYKPKEVPAATQPKAKPPTKNPVEPLLKNPINEPRQLALTRFSELPRWVVAPILVQHADFGRSDSMRFNFIHVYGETGLQSQDRTGYIVRDPPIIDDLDVIRSGLRPYMSTVNCSTTDALSRRAGDWMYLLSDILMGQHLCLTGSLTLVGIQSPICIGDNIEFDKHIFHIEGVTHRFSIQSSNGIKTFRTMLSVTHGVKVQQLDGSDFGLYSGTAPEDLRAYAAQASREYTINQNEPSDPPARGAIAERT